MKLIKKKGNGCFILILIGGISAIAIYFFMQEYKNNLLEEKSNETRLTSFESSHSNSTLYQNNFSENLENKIIENAAKIDSLETSELTTNEIEYLQKIYYREDLISNFISAENDRDFPLMRSYLAENMDRFWKLSYPFMEDVQAEYIKTWSKYEKTHTEILEMNSYGNVFIITVRFIYGTKSSITKTTIVFNDKDEITEIF